MCEDSWLAVALRSDIRGRALRVALVVGTLLTLINQGDAILTAQADIITALKILLTYCVPYGVATYAGVAASRGAD